MMYPAYIPVVFILTTLLTVYFFYRATNKSQITLSILLIWLGIQAYVASNGYYTDTSSFPPRFVLLPLPPLITIILLFILPSGRRYLDRMDIKMLTILHVVRIPVELVLYWIYLQKGIPELMTFNGRNWDIISGITAPMIFYFGFVKKLFPRGLLIIWNIVCLALLINIVTLAVLSAPFQFQKFAFDQPNIAILYFPYVCLPCCIVPLVLLSHLVSLRQLIRNKVNLSLRA